MLEGLPCRACAVDAVPPAMHCAAMELREFFTLTDRACYDMAGKGYQMIYWDSHSQYCSVCGAKTALHTEISKLCPDCGHEMFPNIAVAILVLVRKEESALLVRGRNFRGPHYGLVAGFLEPGETLEECVRREVREETSLTVGAVRYFGSQPWPYPSGLMAGFIADYAQGEIILQNEELSAGAFFPRETLPELPNTLSLARRIIDWWINGEDEKSPGRFAGKL